MEGSALCKRKIGSEQGNEPATYSRTAFPQGQWKGKATGKY